MTWQQVKIIVLVLTCTVAAHYGFRLAMWWME